MRIKKCSSCGTYTLKEDCSKCNLKSSPVGPARYSPEDPYGKYRRMMKKEMEDG